MTDLYIQILTDNCNFNNQHVLHVHDPDSLCQK